MSDGFILSYANEVTNGGPLDNFKMGAGPQKDLSQHQKVRPLDQPDIHGGEGREERRSADVAQDLVPPASRMNPPVNTQTPRLSRAASLGKAGKAPGFH